MTSSPKSSSLAQSTETLAQASPEQILTNGLSEQYSVIRTQQQSQQTNQLHKTAASKSQSSWFCQAAFVLLVIVTILILVYLLYEAQKPCSEQPTNPSMPLVLYSKSPASLLRSLSSLLLLNPDTNFNPVFVLCLPKLAKQLLPAKLGPVTWVPCKTDYEILALDDAVSMMGGAGKGKGKGGEGETNGEAEGDYRVFMFVGEGVVQVKEGFVREAVQMLGPGVGQVGAGSQGGCKDKGAVRGAAMHRMVGKKYREALKRGYAINKETQAAISQYYRKQLNLCVYELSEEYFNLIADPSQVQNIKRVDENSNLIAQIALNDKIIKGQIELKTYGDYTNKQQRKSKQNKNKTNKYKDRIVQNKQKQKIRQQYYDRLEAEAKQYQSINFTNSFHNRRKNCKPHLTLEQYLLQNNISDVLTDNVNSLSTQRITQGSLQLQQLSLSTPDTNSHPWLHLSIAPSKTYSNVQWELLSTITHGLSICDVSSEQLPALVLHLYNNGFFYDRTKSLSLTYYSTKNYSIFIRNQPDSVPTAPNKPNPFIAIHAVVDLSTQAPILRQWLLYHISLGVEFFFLHQAPNPTCTPTPTTSLQWLSICTEFYPSILLLPPTASPQQAYISTFSNIANYTAFLDHPYEYLFTFQQLPAYLEYQRASGYVGMRVSHKHFQHYLCEGRGERVIESFAYFPEIKARMWEARWLVETKKYLPGGAGMVNGRVRDVDQKQIRVNGYTLTNAKLTQMHNNRISLQTKFQTDHTMLKYKPILDLSCNNKCPPISTITTCQQLTCLNTETQHQLDPRYRHIKNWQATNSNKNIHQEIIEEQRKQIARIREQKEDRQDLMQDSVGYVSNQMIEQKSVLEYLLQVDEKLTDAPAFANQHLLPRNLKIYLPICLVVQASDPLQPIANSLPDLKYPDYRTIYVHKNMNYYDVLNEVNTKCKRNSLLAFVSGPVVEGLLEDVNEVHTGGSVWVGYRETGAGFEVGSCYQRVYELVGANDFHSTTTPYLHLRPPSPQLLTLALLQLSGLHSHPLPPSPTPTPLRLPFSSASTYSRLPYTPLLHLSQDYPISYLTMTNILQQSINQLPLIDSMVDYGNMLDAIDRQQLGYLPQGHPVAVIEKQYYDRKYQMSRYASMGQLSLCVTVVTHNNVGHNRYKKVLQSILDQHYGNYHLILIDDNSNDNTLNKSIQYLHSRQFPSSKLILIRNHQRMHATYNILNAGYMHCNSTDIQVIIDGDDEIIGRYVFAMINTAYRRGQYWLVYTNYKSNRYEYGRSTTIRIKQLYQSDGRRMKLTRIGAIRTWKVQLLRAIPIEYHKVGIGQWLDTLYDDALQYCMLQLTGIGRTYYLPQIMYEYNVGYGDNDDSTLAKVKHRREVYQQVLGMAPLMEMEALQQGDGDVEVREELQAGRGDVWEVLGMSDV